MNLEHELVVNGGLNAVSAAAFASLPDLQVRMHTRRLAMALEPGSLVVVCYGQLVEEHLLISQSGDSSPRKMLVNVFGAGSTFLAGQITGRLRTRAPSNRILVSNGDWKGSAILRDLALKVAIKHGASMSDRLVGFGFASCKERLEYLRDKCGMDFSKWSKTEIAEFAGMSREMVSRMIKFGELV